MAIVQDRLGTSKRSKTETNASLLFAVCVLCLLSVVFMSLVFSHQGRELLSPGGVLMTPPTPEREEAGGGGRRIQWRTVRLIIIIIS